MIYNKRHILSHVLLVQIFLKSNNMSLFTLLAKCGVLLVTVFIALGAQAATYKIATDIQANGTAGRLLTEFAVSVETRTNGRVKFKIFHGGVLGDQLQYFQHIQRGVVDLGLINSASLEAIIPAFGVMNMPYIFRSAEEYRQVMADAEVKRALFESASQHRFVLLGFMSSDFRSIYSTKPIRTYEDLSKLRLRTIASQTYIEMLDRFGAVPTILPFSELYSAMQQGVVDGAEGGMAGLYEAKFSEIAKYVVLTEHTRLTDFVVASEKFYRALSAADLKIVNEEFDKVSVKSIDYAEEKEKISIKKAMDESGVQFSRIDKAPLIQAVVPMYTKALQDDTKAPLLNVIFSLQERDL
jgi:tripartite ATP-independent transporter DctP family solute receptor